MFKWGKYSRGYEVSDKGDARFSDRNAVLPGGRTILEIYNCDIKGYAPGGTDWKLGHNKPPLDRTKDLWEEYLSLWREWADNNPHMIEELKVLAMYHDFTLTERDATTNVNAARALITILNERYVDQSNIILQPQQQFSDHGVNTHYHMSSNVNALAMH